MDSKKEENLELDIGGVCTKSVMRFPDRNWVALPPLTPSMGTKFSLIPDSDFGIA